MKAVKRILDILLSFFALLLLSPFFLVIAAVIVVTSGCPVFFRQERVGRDEKIFRIYKFRTMRRDAPNCPTGELKDADQYITKFGKILRLLSIDELPQILNVLGGTMSIVGPRPLVPAEEEVHSLRRKAGVYAVRPGITGWAQVNGRDDLNAEQKTAFDKEYVEHYSIWFDLKILAKTVLVVLNRNGIKEA